MNLPNAKEVIFTLKCFIAALLALYIALAFALPRPFWAMMTCYIIANPFSGPVRSKAVFRVIGTILGSIATIVMVPPLANAPELLSLALASWVGLCLFISLLDRTPRAYTFMLAGYTAALIGFPSVNDPAGIFDIALSRVEEISIGIVCGSLVHGILLPQSWGPVMLGRLSQIMQHTQQALSDVFAGSEATQLQKDKRQLAADIGELRALAIHLPFDTSHMRWTAEAIYSMHEKLSLILPLLSGTSDRLRLLRSNDHAHLMPAWNQLLSDIKIWVKTNGDCAIHASKKLEQFEQISVRINNLMPTINERSSWPDLIQLNLANRLHELIRLLSQVLDLHQTIVASNDGSFPTPANQSQKHLSANAPLHHDYRLAFMSSVAAIAAILSCCVFWIATGWSSGSVSAMMAAVFCCFFAVQDDPVPSIKTFLYFTLASIPVSALYLLWILPAVHSFESMALSIFPLLFILGIYLARPAHGLKAIALILGVLGNFALQESGAVDVGVFMNATIAQTIGVIVALVMTALLRSVDATWRAQRLMNAGHEDLIALTTGISVPHIRHIASKMMDRVSQLAPRLSLATTDVKHGELHAVDAMLDFRISMNLVQLLQIQNADKANSFGLANLMRQLGIHFSNSSVQNAPVNIELVASIDNCLRQLSADPDVQQTPSELSAISCLVGIRRDLFPDVCSYHPLTHVSNELNLNETP